MLPSTLITTGFAVFARGLSQQAQQTQQKFLLHGLRKGWQGHQDIASAADFVRLSSTAARSTRQKSWLQEAKGWGKIAKQLSKARLSALVVSTTAVGFLAGSGDEIAWSQMCWTAAGTFGASACANTLNQVYEVANDAKMKRTMMRPLPLGRVSSLQALAFAAVMGIGGTAVLAEKANGLTAGLGLANILLYAGVYTPMKVVSATNTWVGAIVGGIPPLMGWTAASGSLEPGAAVLAAALYFWQIPHFLALAWLHREDYMRGGYAMLSRFDKTGRRTASCALRNSLYMLPIGVFAVWVGTASWPFAYEAAIGAGTLATTAAIFYQRPTLGSARTLFRFSIAFLPAFMLGLVVHRVPNNHTVTFASLKDEILTGLSLEGVREEEQLREEQPLREDMPYHKYPAIPIPFLPAPLQYRCPSKIACEGSDQDSEIQPSEKPGQKQI